MAARVACPNCGAEVEWIVTNKLRPFCGERCKLMDLGAWANEEYRVPVKEDLNPGETSEKSLKPAPTKAFKDVPMV